MKKIKRNILYSLHRVSVLVIIILSFQSCSKKSDIDNSEGDIKMGISTSVTQFSDGGIKKQGSTQEPEVITNSMEFSKEFLMISTLTPITEKTVDNSINYANSNSKKAALGTSDLDIGEVYKLIIYNADGTYRAYRNYKYGSEDLTEALSLPTNRIYTFIAYSLNSTDFTALDNVFPDSTVSLSQAKIIVDNNPDLLVFQRTMTVNSTNKNVEIIFSHQFNEITTIIDAAATGYSIETSTLQTRFNIARNRAAISFSDFDQLNSAQGGFQLDLNGTSAFDFSSANGVANSIATSKSPTIINSDNNTSLFSVRNIKIGTVTNSILNPFPTGVNLLPGYKYRLEVKIIPRDKTLVYEGKPCVLLGGQVWMRYSLGSAGDLNNSDGSDADIANANIHGAYYQWGKKVAGINANATTTNSNWDNNGIAGDVEAAYFKRWNLGTETAPIRGTEDPCPSGFRLPVKKDFETLLSYIPSENRSFPGTPGNVNYVMRLVSRYNANAKLTFPASGYGYMGNDGGSYNVGFGGLLSRYREVHLKTSFYGNGTPTVVNSSGSPSGTAYKTSYMLYSPTATATAANRIMTYPTGGPRVSAPVNAHPVRCIAINSALAISMNEREIASGGNNNVDYN